MMESLKKQFYIFFFIVLFSSWVAASMIEETSDEEIKKQTLDSLMGKLCPPLGLGIRYEVAMIQTPMTMFGCAYLEHNRTISAAPLFNLWLKRPGKTTNDGHCKDMRNMDHFAFECVSKKEPTKKEEIFKGWNYVQLIDHSQPKISQDINDLVLRCAAYEVNDAPAEGVKMIRMVISPPSNEQMLEDLCDSLSRTMAKDDPTYISEGDRTWPDGSVYLYMLGKPALDGSMNSMKHPTNRPMKSTTTMPYISEGHRTLLDWSEYLFKLAKLALDEPMDSMKHPTSRPMKSTTTMPYISEGHRTLLDWSEYLFKLAKLTPDGPMDSMKHPTSRPMKSTTTMPLTTMQTTTNSIRTTRYNEKRMEYLDSRTTTTKMPVPQNIFDYFYML
ncbi:uncharacterized protein LOC126552185 [Aphis gossypii]|uniref:uncharacterized protein LOC126552185 n=1 Tax=Aphis gossypii TaxID=80765 RepID=UPI002158F45D|nr:uncharacterized protein LOC126552185 [Aphis gossypii]